MEPMHKEALSRDDIKSILNERHLKIPAIELMTNDELLRIYNTFALPLEKRESKRLNIISDLDPQVFVVPPNTRRPLSEDIMAQTIILNNHLNVRQDPHLLQQTKYLKLSYHTISNSTRKRISNFPTSDSDEEVTPPKRTPMIWQ